ncbi:MAG: hypothetical protein OIN88_00305 [Candidatus Methanoperedens sp.]|nr:hypothetical protein [Candidatus Methanoperedens sp.]MCZ7360824.1 hypothetical protein [Candidatus Methanoperedens sp.]HLB72329.1 hypothetical protein [Candidatus Methanoperedens sp.]
MGLKDFSDEQLKEMIKDPNKFFTDKKNQYQLLGLDSATKRRMADIMKYDLQMDKAEIKERINKMAGKEIRTVVIKD